MGQPHHYMKLLGDPKLVVTARHEDLSRWSGSLAWATLCFLAYGEDVAPWRARLVARYARTAFLGETKAVALALLALSDGAEAFRT